MTNFLLLIIICFLYSIRNSLKKPKETVEKEPSIQELLPTFLGKTCEISFLRLKANIKGILRDIDDEWIVIDCIEEKFNYKKLRTEEKQTVTNVFKISILSDIKEIKDDRL